MSSSTARTTVVIVALRGSPGGLSQRVFHQRIEGVALCDTRRAELMSQHWSVRNARPPENTSSSPAIEILYPPPGLELLFGFGPHSSTQESTFVTDSLIGLALQDPARVGCCAFTCGATSSAGSATTETRAGRRTRKRGTDGNVAARRRHRTPYSLTRGFGPWYAPAADCERPRARGAPWRSA